MDVLHKMGNEKIYYIYTRDSLLHIKLPVFKKRRKRAYDSAISLLGIHSKRLKHILSTAALLIVAKSMNERMQKEKVVIAYSGTLSSIHKEENPAFCDNMGEPGEQLLGEILELGTERQILPLDVADKQLELSEK